MGGRQQAGLAGSKKGGQRSASRHKIGSKSISGVKESRSITGGLDCVFLFAPLQQCVRSVWAGGDGDWLMRSAGVRPPAVRTVSDSREAARYVLCRGFLLNWYYCEAWRVIYPRNSWLDYC